ncbi:MAG: DUF4214 domain-containing protein [Spartobacteria bacterium]|nr:DUF4214 domain-containing protein [Spartobacteria bacterium]
MNHPFCKIPTLLIVLLVYCNPLNSVQASSTSSHLKAESGSQRTSLSRNIEQLYNQYLQRAPDPEGLAYFIQQIKTNNRDLTWVESAIRNSSEYKKILKEQKIIKKKRRHVIYWISAIVFTLSVLFKYRTSIYHIASKCGAFLFDHPDKQVSSPAPSCPHIFWLRTLLFAVYLTLIILRVPSLLFPGRFWAEEGSIYFQQACAMNPLTYLTTTNLGYYSLFNKCACLLASISPLMYATCVTAFCSLLIQLIPAYLILYSKIPALPTWATRIMALSIILFIQPNQEVWLNTINSQFFLCLSTGIILISYPYNSRHRYFRIALLFLAGLTGVVPCLLLPFFFIHSIYSRNKEVYTETAVLFITCIIQGLAVVSATGRASVAAWHILPFVLLIKQGILPISGSAIADGTAAFILNQQLYENNFYVMLAFFIPLLCLAYILRYGRPEALLLSTASLFIAAISFSKSVDSRSCQEILNHIHPYFGGRYYFASNAFLALSLLMPPKKTSIKHFSKYRLFSKPYRRYTAGLLLATCMIYTGVMDYLNTTDRHPLFFSGPNWFEQVRKYEQGSTELQIWPAPMTMKLCAPTIFNGK